MLFLASCDAKKGRNPVVGHKLVIDDAWAGDVKLIYSISYPDLEKILASHEPDDPFAGLAMEYPAELFSKAGFPEIKDTTVFYDWANDQLTVIASDSAHSKIESILGVKGMAPRPE